MTPRDFREFLSLLENQKELLVVSEEVQPEPDVGSMGRAACDMEMDGGGPALLCRNVSGYQIPLAFCLHASNRRVALSLGLRKDVPVHELFHAFCERWDRYPVAPVVVQSGPCKEVVKTGSQVNLAEFPVVRWNTSDGGPYICKTAVITKDPETGHHNVGLYRIQLKDRNLLGVPVIPAHDIGRHYQVAQELGKKELDVAIALGNDPALSLASCSPLPPEWEEYSYAGALKGEPLSLVKAETVDLLVPATSEIIIEGKISLTETAVEGPFAEFPGYYSHTRRKPEIRVTAVTHRTKPIFEGLYIGVPWTECDGISQIANSVSVYKEAKLLAPELESFNLASSWCLVGIASMKKRYAGQDKKVMSAVLATPHASYGMKVLLIVDHDIDPFNLDQVMWALATRFDPSTGITLIPNATMNPLDPIAPGKAYGMKMVLNLTEAKPPQPVPPLGIVKPPLATDRWREILERSWKS
jgi:4-hydroxybenzoate decarboxylase